MISDQNKKGGGKVQIIKITLAAARVNSGLTQAEFAKKIGVSLSTVINWEKGRTEPDVSQLRKISELSGIPMDYIFVPRES